MEYLRFHQLRKKTLFMTKEGLDMLKRRLDSILQERREAVEHMRALDRGDQANQLALMNQVQRLEAAEAEATQLSDLLQHVEPIVKDGKADTVQIGSTVTLETGPNRQTYTVVCPLEVDATNNKISEDSPLGKALLNKRPNETVSLTTRKGIDRFYKIVAIH